MGRDASSRVHDGKAVSDAGRLETSAIDRLRRIGGERLVGAMLRSFLEHAPQRLAAADDAVAAGDGPGLGAVAHALKSSAGNVGARALQAEAARVEHAAEAADADLAALLAGLRSACRQAIAAAEAALANTTEAAGDGPAAP